MSKVETLHKNLLVEWAKENKNVTSIGSITQEIDSELKHYEVLSKLRPAAANLIHKDFFEISVLHAVLVGDLKAFEMGITKVLCFYESQTTESPNKYLMVGLYLMHLLSSNRVSEFHMLLEQIDQSIQQQNPFIKTPVQLEQFIVEGAYNKVMLNRMTLPSPYYAGFVQILMETVRNEIAACVEKSYKTMPYKDAASVLLFDNQNDVIAFGKQRAWKLEGNEFVFEAVPTPETNAKSSLDTKRIIEMNLRYAKQLEMII